MSGVLQKLSDLSNGRARAQRLYIRAHNVLGPQMTIEIRDCLNKEWHVLLAERGYINTAVEKSANEEGHE